MEVSTETPLATWSDPACALTVVYPLPLLHEIEFVASEGYRRIPRGGIEHGGVLYGRVQDDTIRIEAFRAIECEHAFGPSFVLSANDIERLRGQLHSAPAEPELSGLTVLGWFISHSRSRLEVTSREWAWFDSLFPDSWQVLLLIKPEKFKPTRFAFAFRGEGQTQRSDLTSNAFVLPLPTRSDRTKRGRQRQCEEPTAPESRKETTDQVAVPPKEEPSGPPAPESEDVRQDVAARPQAPVTLVPRRWPLALWVCCIVCCVLVMASGLRFYWIYGASPLSLHAVRQGSHLLVSWPVETGANSGELKVQSGDAMQTTELSASQMRTGEVTIGISGADVRIELIAHHWLHDERGLLRVLLPERATK
jgi:hypothetical protein